jgi:adenylate kinase
LSLYIILMGVQGAGKGVQAQFISETYGIPHVSTGDLFRAMKQRDDPLARRVQEIMAAGLLVDDDTTNEVVRDRLDQPDAANGAILDGYPRNRKQAQWFENYLASHNAKITVALVFKLDLYVAFKRAFGRVTSKDGESYNIFYNNEGIRWEWMDDPQKEFPPRLAAFNANGEPLIRRPDDANAGAVIKRIDLYLETTQPLIEYFQQEGLLVEIDAEKAIDEVSREIVAAIETAKQR